jgi:hypothetical protein
MNEQKTTLLGDIKRESGSKHQLDCPAQESATETWRSL